MRSIQYITIALVLSAGIASSVRGGWETLPNAPDRGPGRHEDAWFVDEMNGWVVNGSGEIWHTSDAGETWELQTDTKNYVRSVTFVSPTRGWIGHLHAKLPDLMYETFDGGANWTPVPNLPAASPEGICAMWAVNEQVIYASGVYNGPAGMLKTTNGGTAWNAIDMSPYANTLVDCYFPTPEHGFVVGGIGEFGPTIRARVLETTNGGTTWMIRHTSSEPGEWCWKISFPSPLAGYVSVERGVAGPERILGTTDGGATWTEKPAPDSREQGIGFISEQVGWLGGGVSTYLTLDGGTTWSLDNFGTRINRIRVLAPDLAYAVGAKVYRFRGTVDVEEPPASVSLRIQPAFPNPFVESVMLPFVLPETGDVRVSVFDLRGRLIRELTRTGVNAGESRILWNGLNSAGHRVAAGGYVARFTTTRESSSVYLRVLR